MASTSDRATNGTEDVVDALPRTEADLEACLEKLRDFVMQGGMTPMQHRLWLDLNEFEERLDQIIDLVPKEVRRARRITREEQRIVQDAKDEARRILEEARAEGDQIVTQARETAEKAVEASAIRQRALEQAEATISQAEETAVEIRRQSYVYAQQVMQKIETSM